MSPSRLLPRQLHLQVIGIVSLLLLITTGLYAWYTAGVQSANLTQAIKNQTFVTAKNVADLSTNYMLTQDFASLEALLVKTAEFPNVASISLTDEKGKVLSRVETGQDSRPRVDYASRSLAVPAGGPREISLGQGVITAWHPVFEESLLGWVNVEYSLQAVTDLRKGILRDAALNAALVVAGSTGLLLFFLIRPIRSVRRATEFAKRLTERKGDLIEVDRGSMEIEELMTALNSASGKLAEQERSLRESAERLEMLRQRNLLILQSAGEGIIGLDSSGVHTFVNTAAENMLGYQAEELSGKTAGETWYGSRSSTDAGEGRLYAMLLDGSVHHVDGEQFRKKDGTCFPAAFTKTPIRENDRVTGAVISFMDISERARAEEALRESERKYRTLFEESKDGILFSTPRGAILDINSAGVELFGFASREEMLKVDISADLYADPGTRAEFARIVERNGFIKDYEAGLRRKDGSHLVALITATAVRDGDGAVTAYREIIRDVTSERRLEQQLRQAQKMEAVGQLTGGIAHDFNNILTAITSYGYLLQSKLKEGHPGQTYVKNLLSSAERASNLTQSLLTFSRKQILIPAPVALNQIVLKLEKLLSKLIGEDIELRMRLADEDLVVVADSGQIEQVLMNFAANSRDAMPQGGTLTIETGIVELDDGFPKAHGYGEPGTYACISVSDSGTGMDEQTLKRIYEPFFTTKEVGKGTGLGLSIVYGIVKQHNGYVNVYSEPGAGTTFKVYLPLHHGAAAETETGEVKQIPGGRETVLLAEDDEEVRGLALMVLAEKGYTVIEARDGEEAVENFRQNDRNVDILLLDVIMPKKNGKEAYEEIRKIRPGIKALFMSGYTADVIQKRQILEEGLHFLSKPVSPNELLKKLREMLDA